MNKRPIIATMIEPDPQQVRRALIVQAYYAREFISDAFVLMDKARHEGTSTGLLSIKEKLKAAAAFLGTVQPWLRNEEVIGKGASSSTRVSSVIGHVMRSIAAAQAHVAIHEGWTADNIADRTLRLDQIKRSSSHALAALEAARTDAHRALAEIAERFPGAIDIEEV